MAISTRHYYLTLAVITVLFLSGGMVFYESRSTPTARVVDTIKEGSDSVVILKNPGPYIDLSQDEEGTIVVDLLLNDRDINLDEEPPDKVLLFRSLAVKGLSIYYNYHEKTISAGTPILTTPRVDVIDGKMHQIVYTFKKNDKQSIYIDGYLVIEGGHSPASGSKATGMAVAKLPAKAERNVDGGRIALYERAVSAREVRRSTFN